MSQCVNCGNQVETPFCSVCGQKNPVRKINVFNLWNDFLSRVYGFDGMFPRTLRDLTVRPGEAARQYISGNRVRYYGPLGYLLLMATVYLLVVSILEIDVIKMNQRMTPFATQVDSGAQQELIMSIMNWMNDSMRLMIFVIAIFGVFLTWLLFRKSGYNLIESSVLIFYVNGHLLWVNIVLLFLYKFADYTPSVNTIVIVSIIFTLFAYVDFYKYQAAWKVVLKGLISYVGSFILLMILGFIILIYMLKTDKEFYEKVIPKSENASKTELPISK